MMGAFYINKIIHTRLIQDVGVDIEHVGCFFRLTYVIPQGSFPGIHIKVEPLSLCG